LIGQAAPERATDVNFRFSENVHSGEDRTRVGGLDPRSCHHRRL